jgi:hypothetical protein
MEVAWTGLVRGVEKKLLTAADAEVSQRARRKSF